MCIICSAIVTDELDRQFLCEVVESLGGKANISGDTVCVEYNGPQNKADEFAKLFESYDIHGISTIL